MFGLVWIQVTWFTPSFFGALSWTQPTLSRLYSLKIFDRPVLWSWESLIDIFWGSKVVKGQVGFIVSVIWCIIWIRWCEPSIPKYASFTDTTIPVSTNHALRTGSPRRGNLMSELNVVYVFYTLFTKSYDTLFLPPPPLQHAAKLLANTCRSKGSSTFLFLFFTGQPEP